MSNSVHLRDGLGIYKQKGSKNYYVYLRQKDDSGQTFDFRKSTRTPDLSKAIEEAWGYYFSYTKRLSPEIFEANSKSKVVNICNSLLKILDEKTKSSNKRSPQSAAYAACIRNEVIPNLPKSLVIKNFDKKLIKSILNLARSTTKRRNLTSSIKKIFEYAEDEGMIKSYLVPEISTDEKVEKSEPRRSFSDFDFLKISDSFSNFTKQRGLKPCSVIYRNLLMYKFYLLYHTGCRPGEEVDNLKYSCVTKASKDSYKLRFNGTKTDRDGKSRIIELTEDALMCIIHVHEYFNASLYSHLYSEKKGARGLTANFSSHNSEFIDVFFNNKDDDNYIFRLPSKQSKKLDWTNYFKQLMESLSLDYTLYSCRHTFITQRLLEGKTVEDVALYCGTSGAMIEKYYSDVNAEMISQNVNADRIAVLRTKTKPSLFLN